MERKRRSIEEKKRIVAAIDKAVSGGMTISAASRGEGVADVLYRRWRKEFSMAPPAPVKLTRAEKIQRNENIMRRVDSGERLSDLVAEYGMTENAFKMWKLRHLGEPRKASPPPTTVHITQETEEAPIVLLMGRASEVNEALRNIANIWGNR